MSVAVEVRAPNLEALVGKLSRALSDSPSRRMMTLIGADLVRSTKRRIGSEKTTPDGTPWVAWSDAYEARKRAGSMLKMSGELQRSIESIVGDSVIAIGTDDVKGGVHQYGHTVSSGPFAGAYIPARQYLGLSDADEAGISDRMVDDMRRRFGAQ